MADTQTPTSLTTVLLGLAGGAISGLSAHYFAPWFKWKLELRKDEIQLNLQLKEQRRKQIARWRRMLPEAETVAQVNGSTAETCVQRNPEFLALEPYLTEEAKRAVYGRNFVVTAGNEFSNGLMALQEEISRLEGEWDLR